MTAPSLTEQRERIWQHALHEDTLFNERLNSFLVFHSVLLAVAGLFSASVKASGRVTLSIATAGILASVLWGYIQLKQWHTVRVLGKRCIEMMPEFAETHRKLKASKWRGVSSSLIVAVLFPLLFCVIWVTILCG